MTRVRFLIDDEFSGVGMVRLTAEELERVPPWEVVEVHAPRFDDEWAAEDWEERHGAGVYAFAHELEVISGAVPGPGQPRLLGEGVAT